MGKSAVISRTWAGGASVDGKMGTDSSFKKSRAVNHRKKVSSIELHRKYVKESGSIVDTQVLDAVRTPDSSVWFMGDTKLYRRLVDAVGEPGEYSVFQSGLSNVKSGSYNRDRKRLYLPANKTIHAVNYADEAAPTFMSDLVGQILDQQVTNTGTLAYTVPAAIDEGDAHKITFQPDIEPYIKVGVYVIAKGTGDLIFTLHDAADNVLATQTIPAASVTADALNYATFDDQVRLSAYPNPYEYHLHVTTSNGSGTTLRTATADDLSAADFESYADALVDGVYHPCGEFLQYVVIGNDNYVAAWEPITDDPTKTEYQPHRLKLPSEYRVLGFTEYKEYYVISAYKSVSSDYGDEFGANSTEGLLGFWDGASRGFAWFVKIEGGAMEGAFTYNGFVYGWVNGVLHVTSGDIPVPVYEVPGLVDFTSSQSHDDDVYLKAPYNGMCVTDNILQMAYPMLTANDNIIPGVYSFGRKTKDYAESIAFDHIPSHGETAVKYDTNGIPMSGVTYLGRFGKNTFMAWQSADANGNAVYGIDVLNNTNAVYDSGVLHYLEMDNKVTYKIKQAVEIITTYTQLPGNATIKPFYLINGEASPNYGDASDLTHDSENQQFILKIPKEYRVIEYGIELVASTDPEAPGSPVVDSTALIIETNSEEGL